MLMHLHRQNVHEYSSIVDNLILIDNSTADGEILLEINDKIITFTADKLPTLV